MSGKLAAAAVPDIKMQAPAHQPSAAGKSMTVNIHSPKAYERAKQFDVDVD
jgi:hypothetical protein